MRNYRGIGKQLNLMAWGGGISMVQKDVKLSDSNINSISLTTSYQKILSLSEFKIGGKCDLELYLTIIGLSESPTLIDIYITNNSTQIGPSIKQEINGNQTISINRLLKDFIFMSGTIDVYAKINSANFSIGIKQASIFARFTNYTIVSSPVIGPETVNNVEQLAVLLSRYYSSWAIIAGSIYPRWIGSKESNAIFTVPYGGITCDKPFSSQRVEYFPYTVNLTTMLEFSNVSLSFYGYGTAVIYTNSTVNFT